jgi:hypothetical protein
VVNPIGEMTERVRRLMRRMHNYAACFRTSARGDLTDAGAAVLADMARYCGAYDTTVKVSPVTRNIDPIASAVAEGRRQAYLSRGDPVHDGGRGKMTDTPNPNPAGDQQPWYASIADESLRGRAELSKFDTPEKVLSAYVNLEKHIGVPPDRLLKLPETPDAPEWAEIKARIPGLEVPAEAKDYELPIPEGFNADYAGAVAANAERARGVQ